MVLRLLVFGIWASLYLKVGHPNNSTSALGNHMPGIQIFQILDYSVFCYEKLSCKFDSLSLVFSWSPTNMKTIFGLCWNNFWALCFWLLFIPLSIPFDLKPIFHKLLWMSCFKLTFHTFWRMLSWGVNELINTKSGGMKFALVLHQGRSARAKRPFGEEVKDQICFVRWSHHVLEFW